MLYLVQHGDAVAKAVDPDRPLTDAGRDDVARVADFLAHAGISVQRMIHSGRTRARQTAEILAAALAPGRPLEAVSDGLGPTDTTRWLLAALPAWSEDTMVVGHLPFMAKAVARLVWGADDPDRIAFTPGSVVCLERAGEAFALQWMVRPSLVVRPIPV